MQALWVVQYAWGGGRNEHRTPFHLKMGTPSFQPPQSGRGTAKASLPLCWRGAERKTQPTLSSPTRPCVQRSHRSSARGSYCPSGWSVCIPLPSVAGGRPPLTSQAHQGGRGCFSAPPHTPRGRLGQATSLGAGVNPAVVSWEGGGSGVPRGSGG